jgi:hypothetical protein
VQSRLKIGKGQLVLKGHNKLTLKGVQIVYVCSNVRLAHSSIRTVCDIADRIKEGAKSGTKVVSQSIGMDHTKNYGC